LQYFSLKTDCILTSWCSLLSVSAGQSLGVFFSPPEFLTFQPLFFYVHLTAGVFFFSPFFKFLADTYDVIATTDPAFQSLMAAGKL